MGQLVQTLQKVGFDDTTFRCASVASEGTLLSYATEAGFVEKVSGSPDPVLTKVAGVLMSNVVNRGVPSNHMLGEDTGTTELPRNFNANQTPQSGMCRLLKQGIIETDQVDASATFGQGSGVYIGDDGLFTTAVGTGASELVGHALTAKRDGYVRVYVNIQ